MNSLFIIICAFIVAGYIIFAIEYSFIGGGITKIPLGYLITHKYDHKTEVVYLIHEANQEESDDYRVYLFGGSSAREAINSEKGIENILQSDIGLTSDVIMLAYENQSLLDVLLMVDNLPDGSGMVVIGMGPAKLKLYEEFNDLPLISKLYTSYLYGDEYVREKYFENFNLYSFYGLNLIKQIATGSLSDFDYYTNLRATDYHYRFLAEENEAFDENVENVLNTLYDVTTEDVEFFTRIINEIIDLAEDKGLDIILWDTPYNWQALGDTVFDEDGKFMIYRNTVSAICDERGVFHSDFVWDIDMEALDGFYDITHIDSPEVRTIIQEELAYDIIEYLNK